MSVEFKSRFLRPAEAMLILVGHRVGSASGTTMVFKLVSQIDDVIPLVSNEIFKLILDMHVLLAD